MSTKLDEARIEILALTENVPIGTRWRHLKSGNDYMVTGHAIIEATLTPAVIYSRYGQTDRWCRPGSEFLDGRFENVTEY